jgi:hypothetical protein
MTRDQSLDQNCDQLMGIGLATGSWQCSDLTDTERLAAPVSRQAPVPDGG